MEYVLHFFQKSLHWLIKWKQLVYIDHENA